MKYLIVIGILLTGSPASAQAIAMQLDKINVLYLGVDNPVTVAVEGYPNDSIFLTTNNGTITGGNGHFIIRPEFPTTTMPVDIKAKTARGVKNLGYRTFRAKFIPTPVAYLQNRKSGNLSLSLVRSAIGPYAVDEGLTMDSRYRITRLTIAVVRNSSLIFSKTLKNENGVRFTDDEETRRIIQMLQAGDKLKLEEMTYSNPVKTCGTSLSPLEFVITN